MTLRGSRPDATEGAWAFLEVLRIQAVMGRRLRIQLDLTDQVTLAEDPSRVFAHELVVDDSVPFAHLVSPLIIEADGMVVPLQYGFARRYALGNVRMTPLFELARRWRQDRYPAFRQLCRSVFRQLIRRKRVAMLNWYETVSLAAEREASSARA